MPDGQEKGAESGERIAPSNANSRMAEIARQTWAPQLPDPTRELANVRPETAASLTSYFNENPGSLRRVVLDALAAQSKPDGEGRVPLNDLLASRSNSGAQKGSFWDMPASEVRTRLESANWRVQSLDGQTGRMHLTATVPGGKLGITGLNDVAAGSVLKLSNVSSHTDQWYPELSRGREDMPKTETASMFMVPDRTMVDGKPTGPLTGKMAMLTVMPDQIGLNAAPSKLTNDVLEKSGIDVTKLAVNENGVRSLQARVERNALGALEVTDISSDGAKFQPLKSRIPLSDLVTFAKIVPSDTSSPAIKASRESKEVDTKAQELGRQLGMNVETRDGRISLTPRDSADWEGTAKKALEFARETGSSVDLNFNHLKVRVNPSDNQSQTLDTFAAEARKLVQRLESSGYSNVPEMAAQSRAAQAVKNILTKYNREFDPALTRAGKPDDRMAAAALEGAKDYANKLYDKGEIAESDLRAMERVVAAANSPEARMTLLQYGGLLQTADTVTAKPGASGIVDAKESLSIREMGASTSSEAPLSPEEVRIARDTIRSAATAVLVDHGVSKEAASSYAEKLLSTDPKVQDETRDMMQRMLGTEGIDKMAKHIEAHGKESLAAVHRFSKGRGLLSALAVTAPVAAALYFSQDRDRSYDTAVGATR